ncbi:MAG: ASKHA domain-containing protein [Defluviitaleaceae bacterium]|nr:ASKHA domain-containing protein [Defluviitaleaceae bacterium]
MPAVTFLPYDVTVEAAAGAPLLKAAAEAGLAAGFTVEAPCGGNGSCKKCRARLVSGDIYAEADAFGFILLCLSHMGETDLVVDVSVSSAETDEKGRFDETGEEIDFDGEIDFPVKQIEIEIAEPAQGDGLSDLDRLKNAAAKFFKGSQINIPLPFLAELPKCLRGGSGKKMLAYEKTGTEIQAVGLYDINFSPLGLAADIGTTTVAAKLIDADGRTVASRTAYNLQISCGHDVISRINYARDPQRRAELKRLAVKTINNLIKKLVGKNNDNSQIINVSVAANTTMTHLLLGIDPEYIRLAPYTPAVFDVPRCTAHDLCIDAAPCAPVRFAPAVGSYVGGDITAGLLCTPIGNFEQAGGEDLCLFIDIGTNGEIALGGNGFLLTCACSAGPAFEGGGVSCGMRASAGAIENVTIDDNKKPSLEVIGGGVPKGICGSGIIALIAELLRAGLIDPSGRFDDPDKRYALGGGLYITEADVQNVIRAKAAVFSACRTLVASIGADLSEINELYIAGGFGRYLNINNAKKIGLVPDLPNDKIKFIGNSSLAGAHMTLISEKFRRLQAETAARATYIDLSSEPGYMNEYTAALFLPHTDASMFRQLA